MIDEPLPGLSAFVAVAERRSFTAAAAELDISPSAVSQTLRKLEARLGVRLLQRTTRSVGLTEEGSRFLQRIRPMLEGLADACTEMGERRGRPTGTLRLTTPRIGCLLVLEPLLAEFVRLHPSLSVDVTVDDTGCDIVAAGFDAGIRLRESIEGGMVGVRLGGSLRLAVVGSPAYFQAHPRPKHPRDLLGHECIRFRQAPAGDLYAWEFDERGRSFSVEVKGRVVVNDTALMIRAALDGAGLACVLREQVRGELESGRLVSVLDRFCLPFPGLHLYYPSRHQLPAKLRVFVDFLRQRRPAPD